MTDTKDIKENKERKDNKDVKAFKLSQETFNKQSEEAAKILGITSEKDLILFKKLLQEDLQKIEKIKTAFKEDPKLVKITRTKNRLGENRSSQNSNKNLTDKDKALDLNFSMVRTIDEKTKQETIAILMEGRGLNKRHMVGNEVEDRSEVSGKLGKELGAGGIGLVKLGLKLETLDTGAVKISKYNPKKLSNIEDQNLVKQFQREIALKDHQLTTELGRTFGQAETTTKHYSFMKFFPGDNCLNFINRNQSLTDKLDLAFLMAMRLQEMHENGYLHLDIKPDNMVYDTGSKMLTIIDFGHAVKGTKQEGGLYKLLHEDDFGGTVPYLDPYLKPDSNGNYPMSSKTDIYALGVTYFLLFYLKFDYAKGDHAEKLAKDANNLQTTEDGALSLHYYARNSTSIKNNAGVEYLVAWMTTKNEKDRPSFNKILSELSHELIEELGTDPDFQSDLKIMIENSLLLRYIARTEPQNIVQLLMSFSHFSYVSRVKEGVEAILKIKDFIDFLKQNKNAVDTLLKAFGSHTEIQQTIQTLVSAPTTGKPVQLTSEFERKKQVEHKNEGQIEESKQDHPKPS